MNEPWKIVLFGDMSAHREEFEVTRFRTHKIAGLLAYLAYHRGRNYAREALIDLFWPDQDLEAGRNCLSVALSSLRGQLEGPHAPAGSVIVADRSTVRVSASAVTTDAAQFTQYLSKAEQCASDVEKSVLLRTAVKLYRGPLLRAFYDEWIAPHQRHLEEKYFQALCWLIQDGVRRSDIEAASEYVYQGAAVDPLREDIHLSLLRSLEQTGRSADAPPYYRQAEEILRRAGAAPSAQLARLGAALQAQGVPIPAAPIDLTPRTELAPAPRRSEPGAHGTLTLLWAEAIAVEGDQEAERRARCLESITRIARANGGLALSPGDSPLRWTFDGAADALAAALESQRALQDADGSSDIAPARMAMDTIDMPSSIEDRASSRRAFQERLDAMLAAAHGGQILCGETTALLLRQDCVLDAGFRDLGRYRLASESVRVFMAAAPGLLSSFPDLNAPSGEPASLPLSFNRFFGRVLEIEELSRLLQEPTVRLVTLSGVGGVGKTRLALETARRLEDGWRGRVYFVALSGVETAEGVLRAILTALRVSTPGGPLAAAAAAALSTDASLLILDNFDLLVESAADAVQELIERAPQLTCLITSRCLLGLSGEYEFVVSPLSAPPPSASFAEAARSETIQFFVDRARIVRPDFQLTAANTPAVVSLCLGLEGIPLALELAAARSSVLTPRQMLDQLRDRFVLLAGGKRDAPDRHKTMRAAIAWSYQQLPEELRRLFQQLSVFQGGFTLDSARQVCDELEVFDHIWRLRQFSLIQAEEARDGLRYRMLETVREYAAELLAASEEREEIRERHWRYFYDLAHILSQAVESPETESALHQFDEECGNLRAALQYPAIPNRRLYFAASLYRFWLIRGAFKEGRRCLHALLDDSLAGDPEWRAVAQNACGALDWVDGDLVSAKAMFQQSLAAMPHLSEQACLLNNLGLVLAEQEQYPEAQTYFLESVSRYSEIGDSVSRAIALSNLARVEERGGDYAAARTHLGEALPVLWRSGNRLALANALRNYGHVQMFYQEAAEARTLFQENWRIRRELDDRANYPPSLKDMALLEQQAGRPEAAAQLAGLSNQLQQIGQFRQDLSENSRFQNLIALQKENAAGERRLPDSTAWKAMNEQELLACAEDIVSLARETRLQDPSAPQASHYAIR